MTTTTLITFHVVIQQAPLTFAGRLTEKLVAQVAQRFPINFVEIEPNGDPTLRTKIGWYKKTFRILSDQATLFAEARLAAEGNDAMAIMFAGSRRVSKSTV